MLIGLDSHPIEFLEFITNQGYLVSYSSLNKYLTLWSLIDLSAIPIPISFRVTHMHYPGGDYFYLGTVQGTLRVLNIIEKRLTSFELRSSSLHIENDTLVDLSFSPITTSKLLLAYENSGAAIWDFKSNKVIHKFTSEGNVHCSCWSPDGKSIAIGMRDGCVVLWKCEKNPQAYKSFRPDSDARDLNVTAIDTIIWKGEFIVVSGGMPFSANSQISVISGTEFNICRMIELPGLLMPLQILHTPIAESDEMFIILTQDGSLIAVDINDLKLKYLNELYGGTEVLCSRLYTISNEGEGLIEIIKALTPHEKANVLSGGQSIENPSDMYGMLVTGHVSGLIRVWSISTVTICNLCNLSLLAEDCFNLYPNTYFYAVSDEKSCKISCVEVFNSKVLVGFDMGKVGIWEILPQKIILICVHQYHNSPVLVSGIHMDFIITGDLDGNLTTYNINSCQANVIDLQTVFKKKKMQTISITSLCVASALVYIGLSNGFIYIFSPVSQEFLECPELDRRDYKSEVPKKSEFGVLKMLYTCVDPGSIVLCYEKSMSLCEIQDVSVKQSQNWTCPMVSANIAYIRSEVYIYILHCNGVISMLEYSTLNKVWNSEKALPGM